MIARGMNRKGMPLFPVTRYDAAWPPATAVSGADAATMKNTRSAVPSDRRCSAPVDTGVAARDALPAGWVEVDIDLLLAGVGPPGCRRPAPVADEQREHLRGLEHRAERHALVDA